MTRVQPDSFLKPRLLALSVAACFALNASPVRANPAGPAVVHGSVGFNGLGTSALTITNQAGGNAIINWNGFSIGINELTKFQQFANLAVLNRVTSGQVSSILGSLQSDGRVFLINPNGIVFGASARIDVAGMVASSLNLSDQDFLSNRLRFTEVPGAGAVVNNGVIETATGGRVYLVAPTVENNGLIQAKQGEILLAAGKEVELVDGASPFVTVKVTAGSESALNVGNLVAEGGRIGMFGALVRNSGTVEAGGAMVGPGGEIRLVATKDLTLDAGSLVAANGTSGGKVLLQAEGGTNLIGGTVEAKGSAGKGGEVSALGVRVGVVGHGLIDASGETGGGTVLVGGEYQGKNAAVQNAERTYIGSDGVIRADAMTTGDGGRVIVWADGDTRFFGSISARGGSQSGNGGFVETSGKQVLVAAGSVDAGAPNGQGGAWLLDPDGINIVPGVGSEDLEITVDGALLFAEGPGTSVIGVSGIIGAMQRGSDVLLQAGANISLMTDINSSGYGQALTLTAGNDINLASHNVTTGGNLTISAANSINGGSGYPGNTLQSVYGNVTLSGPFNGGAVDVLAYGSITAGAISTDSYNSAVNMVASNGSITTGSIITSPANDGSSAVQLTANAGSISTGSITTGGNQIVLSAAYGVSTGALATTYGGLVSVTSSSGNVATGSITTSAVEAFYGNGSVIINARGSISTGQITTRSLHPSNGYGGDVGLFAGTGTITVNGNIDTRGAAGDAFDSQYYGGTSGGRVTLSRDSDGFTGTGITVLGSILASGGSGTSESSGFAGNLHSGGDGGTVEVGNYCGGFCGPASGGISVTGTIDTSGGAGGSTDNAAASTYGGGGGSVNVQVSGNVAIGSIVATGGNAGAGSDGSYGNGGGGGGSVLITTYGAVAAGSMNASGGRGGDAGGTGSEANGGSGGWADSISISAGSISVPGAIVARGGDGGAGGTAGGGDHFNAAGGSAGYGSAVGLTATSGAIAVGAIDVRGGHGGAGGVADGIGGGFNGASGGDGGEGGFVGVSAAADVNIGSFLGQGGSGGAGGIAPSDGEFQDPAVATGGRGGNGGLLFANAGGSVVIGALDASGGAGGSGGESPDASGGGGGQGGGLNISSAAIVTGSLVQRGGAGGNGGTALDEGGGSSSGGGGGRGGNAGMSSLGSISTGVIDFSGGKGGNGGPIGADFDRGGQGGDGGGINAYGATAVTIGGPILARGGNGGAMLNASLIECGQCTPSGGDGGEGGFVNVGSAGKVQINVGGTLGAVAIDVSGGSGGAGNPSSSPAGNGGLGGSGGQASIMGTPEMTLFGSVLAGGGDGGAGGAGAGLFTGGTGGQGGSGGFIMLDASSVPGSQLGDGTIFVLAGTKFDLEGGFGGAGGANGGSAGSPGIASQSSFLQGVDYFGTIVILDPLSVPEINQGFQQIVEAGDDTTAFVGGEKKDEEEDKSQKELGSCKG